MSDTSKQFYLGKVYNPSKDQLTDQPVFYEPSDLTTHGIVTGMTGSGKTGLCIGLLEEAAMQGYPAIIVDPKGDLTNLVLHFPELKPSDFQPWIDPEVARREQKSPAALAEETAGRWKKGLAEWGLGTEQLKRLSEAAHYTIYTPGSSSGIPVNILASFQAPEIPWEANREVLRERISTTITALLGLIGFKDIDPLRSREHILLANILEHMWSSGHSLSLVDLIMLVQKPPIERLGAFPLDTFFPEKDRYTLAMLLNNFLASPSFQIWMEGQNLDMSAMMASVDGKPRHAIFYLAHLSDEERMFFTTLLFASVEAWMRTQQGTGKLRALLYFDEILGYLPPVANPPSKPILLRLLKQARAFGVGLLLATQNPVDVDYKALSNAGTWMIGRLQTDQDKQRLLDGLQNAGGTIDLSKFDSLISGLKKRVFLLHNIHQPGPILFQTRFALNYLAGPLMREQIPALNRLAGVSAPPPAGSGALPTAATAPTPASTGVVEKTSGARSLVPAGITEYFLPAIIDPGAALSAAGLPPAAPIERIQYQPALLSQAQVRYISRAYNLDHIRRITAVVPEFNGGLLPWDKFSAGTIDPEKLSSAPLPQATYAAVPAWLLDARRLADLQKDFIDWIYRTGTLQLRANTGLNIIAAPGASETEFEQAIREAVQNRSGAANNKASLAYEKKLTAMQIKIERQQLQVKNAEERVSARTLEELGTHGELLLSLVSKRRKSISSSLTKRRMTADAKNALEEERQILAGLEKELAQLQKEKDLSSTDMESTVALELKNVTTVSITPYKKDIYTELFGVAWLPEYIVSTPGGEKALAAFPLK